MIIPHRPIDYYREYHVSLWIGQFPRVEDVDAYFTEEYTPDYWEPSPFAVELGLGYYPPEYLEIHFPEEMVPQPLLTFLMEAAFSESFLHAALAAARNQGIYEAQGIALLYNFDYESKPNWTQAVGPMRFIGTFPFDGGSSQAIYHEVAERAGCSIVAVWFVLQAFRHFSWERKEKQGKEGTAAAREFCSFLENAQEETTAAIIQCLPKRIAAELPKQGGRPVAPLVSDSFGRRTSRSPSPQELGIAAWEALLPVLPSTGTESGASQSSVPKQNLEERGQERLPESAPVLGMATLLRHLRLPRSEDVGRVVYALVSAGFLRATESDTKADFHGLFNLEE